MLVDLNKALVPYGTIAKDRLWILEEFRNFLQNYDLSKFGVDAELTLDSLDIFYRELPYTPIEDDFRILATLLMWLSSNCGKNFIYNATKYTEFMNIEDAYISSFAIENKRVSYVNNGFTLVEFLLSEVPSDPFYQSCHPINKNLTIHTIEVCNHFIKWLASLDGQDFLRQVNILSKTVCSLCKK